MQNIKIIIEYDGADYCGWQTQKAVNRGSLIVNRKIKTVQETIEKTLQKILREKVNLTAAGRTDSHVHAENQTANFKTKSLIKPISIKKALNSNLPKDIVIKSAEYVPLKFNSQMMAKSKVYRYTVLNSEHPSAIKRGFVFHYTFPLNIGLMRSEGKKLLGRHNFKSFQALDIVERFPVATIKNISVIKKGDYVYFEIEADRFLYNMVRNIVGTLLEIGRGYFKKGYMKFLLRKKDRSFAGPTVPARGLTLVEVKY